MKDRVGVASVRQHRGKGKNMNIKEGYMAGTASKSAAAIADIPGLFRKIDSADSWGNHEIYCQEFTQCAIYGNLRMGKLSTIFDALGITRMPNIMFLIQIDGERNVDRRYPDDVSFSRAGQVVRAAQSAMQRRGIEHVVARLAGSDLVCAFAHLDGRSVYDQADRLHVEGHGRALVEAVRAETSYSVSVGVSEFCFAIARFPSAFSEAQMALDQCFRAGRGSCRVYERSRKPLLPIRLDLMNTYLTRLVTAVDQSDAEQCDAIASEAVEGLRKADLTPNSVRLQTVGLVSRICDYFITAGFDENSLLPIAFDASIRALNIAAIDDAYELISAASRRFCELFSGSKQSLDVRFRQSVSDCIEKHSANQSFSLNYLAALNSYSPSYFSRLFSKVFGMPFSRYLTEYRIERAKRLLMQDSLLLSDVAAKTGFRSASYFCAVFKSETGMSPRQFATEQKRYAVHGAPD